MRILFLTDNFPPETNAAATRVFERACYWARWGHEVTVLTSAPNFPEGRLHEGYRNRWYQREKFEGLDVVRVKTLIAPNRGVRMRILDFMSYMASASVVGAFMRRPDLIVATSPQFFCAVAGSNLAHLKRVPFVFELADLWPASIRAVGAIKNGPLLRAVERLELRLYRRSSAVVALTDSFRKDLIQRGVPAEKIAVVRNGVDLSRHTVKPRSCDLAEQLGVKGKFVVGYIGTHGLAHDLGNVLDAAELTASRKDIAFLLVGNGADRARLVEEAQRRGLSNVVLMPAVPKSEVGEYSALCDLALVHLKNDPVFKTVIPSKMFEAMAYAKPILMVSPHGEAAELLENSGAGVWVPAAEPAALAEQVIQLADDPLRRQVLSETSRQCAPRFSRERQAREMADVLERVRQGKPAHAPETVRVAR
ncbi:MAG: glycosyltransferase family 4 protein [Fimbriimonadaceae bacterium]|nr:glycosyltransferase family 4 protein [Chthonomonadaceae bacterium]MCO5297521.1 glycosyltransferase family 4 protein [Fimbriimonadaceae bacterium]